DGEVFSDALEDGMEVETLNGATLTIGVTDEGVTVTDANGNVANVVTADVDASNGVVHVIDGVLLPPSGE
ncbi:MAG: fasciclin domain-containing protein, partial [Chloroflexota bacterium]